MGDQTAIGWTDKTWNPWHGCHHVSPGCDNCYMFAQKKQYGQDPENVVRSKTTFDAPLKWKGPARVFTCSWSDFFIAEADAWRAAAWNIIHKTPTLTYQVLTKRPARIASHLPWTGSPLSVPPFRNVWLGVSVESAGYAYRADVLRAVPAALRFLSLEPLLGDLRHVGLDGIGWVIVGGESGPGHRVMDLDAFATIVHMCRDAGVPIFVKQDSGPKPGKQGRIPDHLWIQEFPR